LTGVARTWALLAVSAAVVAAWMAVGCAESPDLEAQAKQPFEALRKAVREETIDPARADSMLALADSLEQRSLDLIHAVRAENDTLLLMYADRSVEDTALLEAFHRQESRRGEARRALLATRAQLKSVATPVEWLAISKAETKTMSQVAGLARGK
jgi:hypothetical protein